MPLHLPSYTSSFQATPTVAIPFTRHTESTVQCISWLPSDLEHTSTSHKCDFSVSQNSIPSDSLLTRPPLSTSPTTPFDVSETADQRLTVPSIASAIWSLFSLGTINSIINSTRNLSPDERSADLRWIATSRSWWDRQACHLIGVCGFPHFFRQEWGGRTACDSGAVRSAPSLEDVRQPFPHSILPSFDKLKEKVRGLVGGNHTIAEMPQYVLDYAPYVHLYSGEEYWPGDIAEHLKHITPYHNYDEIESYLKPLNLTNLNQLDALGRHVYLQSKDNVEDKPDWLMGEINIPKRYEDLDDFPVTPSPYDEFLESDEEAEASDWAVAGEGSFKDIGGEPRSHLSPGSSMKPPSQMDYDPHIVVERSQTPLAKSPTTKRTAGKSDAPAILVCVDKGDGVVDAFWFFFYSFNLGNKVLNVRFGNHVGDWEHTAIRFKDGEPKAVFFSEHFFGDAYSYEAVEKIGRRPISYSGYGTHAMYATPGVHAYILPWGLLSDVTDRGPLWDPVLNSHMYMYDYKKDQLRASNFTPEAPLEWFYFIGRWGDKTYPLDDPRQYRFLNNYHYESGPTGPRFKNLGRKTICQGNNECKIKNWKQTNRAKRQQARQSRRSV